MSSTTNIFVAATIASVLAGSAFAQTTAFQNDGAADQAVENLEETISDAADRDLGAFGNNGRSVGTYGSLSFSATATSNDGDTSSDVGVGLRYGSFDGVNGYDITLAYKYGKDGDVETDNSLLAGVDFRRDFNSNLFGYAKADLSFDRLATAQDAYVQDIFVGAGVGYRIINSNVSQWTVQAGPGYRAAELVGGEEITEVAASVSSNYYRSLSDTSYVTNDTDVIYSETATTLTNELALNVSMTDTLSLRTSLISKFNDQSDDTFADGENTLGVAVVYNFN